MKSVQLEQKYQSQFFALLSEVLAHGDEGIEAAAMICARGLLAITKTCAEIHEQALVGASHAINDMSLRMQRAEP
jgi:hypothetical protein